MKLSNKDLSVIEVDDSIDKSHKEKIEIDGMILANIDKAQDLEMKKNWSKFLYVTVGSILVFEFLLTILVGLGVLDFSEYEWFLRIIVIGGFAQILIMPFTVVSYLFPKDSR